MAYWKTTGHPNHDHSKSHLQSALKERKSAVCDNMDEPGGHYDK